MDDESQADESLRVGHGSIAKKRRQRCVMVKRLSGRLGDIVGQMNGFVDSLSRRAVLNGSSATSSYQPGR